MNTSNEERIDDIDIIKQAIETYGIDAQVLMAIEEMSELTKALCKEDRKSTRLNSSHS